MNTFGAVFGGANSILHAAGWPGGGLTASYEKFIVDIEMCQMIAETLMPLVVDSDELALDVITEVGPGVHFLGVDHTLERLETAFYAPMVFSRTNFEQWTEEGGWRADERADAQSALDGALSQIAELPPYPYEQVLIDVGCFMLSNQRLRPECAVDADLSDANLGGANLNGAVGLD